MDPSRLHGRYIISRPLSWARYVQLKRGERLFVKRRPLKEAIDDLVKPLAETYQKITSSRPLSETYINLDMKIARSQDLSQGPYRNGLTDKIVNDHLSSHCTALH
jgi:hypothetical protein